ncbi:ABC transporter substrate-binding protein [Streptomyces sp. RS2]|uniref:peptide ABC transporter substrate-binding protein n=1 Tax=Streptomyces sp. RS2 TaxID=1451205 RepID=UPI0021F84D4D|nr:ABC transporter substrate-binding protein [Streptomyces sp. RS2]MCW1100194.1 ABC transporter substrate-binding protein [Streptomyces sp. RS2]
MPTSYLQHFLPGQGDSGVAAAIWTPLTKVDADTGKVTNAVAQSIESTDQKNWTITLKKGWTFHNGEPVTAQSFADSWNATAYAPNALPFNYLFMNFHGYGALNPAKGKPATDKLSGVTVAGERTLKVRLDTPLSTFPDLLAGTPFAPLPKAALKGKDFTAFDKLPIGNGPYQVAAPGIAAGAQQIKLQRYNKYAGTKGNAQTITVKSFQNNSTAFTSFRAGAIDIATVGGNDLNTADRTYHNQLVTTGAPAVVYLGFPLWDKRFEDRRVREAFSLAIDRDGIVKALLHGFAKPADGVIPEVLTGGGQPDCEHCTYDPAKARKLLAQAGGWHGSLTLWTKQDATTQTVLEAVLDQLRKNLGIKNISLQAKPLDQMYGALGAKKVSGPFLLYTGASYPSAYSLVDSLFSSTSGSNVTGYDSKKFAAQLDAAAREGDPAKATALVQKASRTALADAPLTPVYYPQTGLVHSTRVGHVAIDYLADADLSQVVVK